MRRASVASATPPQATSRHTNYVQRERWLGVALISPSVLLVAVLVLYPFVYNIWMSIQDIHLMRGSAGFAGLKNYAFLASDERFLNALWVDVIWTTASIIGQVVLALIIAHLLNEKFVGRGLARSLIILPWTVSAVVIAFVWRWMLNDLFGVINYILIQVGLTDTPVLFFGSRWQALATVIAMNIWRGVPFMTLAFVGGLQGIPAELYEAAKVDGANWWDEFWHITIPGLKRIIAIVVVLRSIWVFNWFDLIWLTTGGGPLHSTETLPVLAYITGFISFRMSRAAAISVLMALVLMAFVVIFFRITRAEDEVRTG